MANATNPDDFALYFKGVVKGGASGESAASSTQVKPGSTLPPSAGGMAHVPSPAAANPDFQIERFQK
jgi:hypothetical protein